VPRFARSRTSTAATSARLFRYSRNPGGRFDPLASIVWHSAFWAEDPEWTAPADGGAVASWRNAGTVGTGYPLAQTDSGKRPAYRAAVAALNNRPAIQGDGIDDFLITVAFPVAVSQINTVVYIGNFGTTGAAALFDGLTGGRHNLFNSSGNVAMNAGASAVGSATTTDMALYVATYNGASSTTVRNGTQVIAGNAGTNSLAGLTVGAFFNGSTIHTGHYAFVGVYNGALPAGDLAKLNAWASSHYGLTIA